MPTYSPLPYMPSVPTTASGAGSFIGGGGAGGFNFANLLKFLTPQNLALLGPILGLFQHQFDPFKELQKRSARLQGELPAETGRMYRMNVASPAFSQAQGALGMANLGLQHRLAASLGERGLSTTGIGAVAGPLAASTLGSGMANLYSDAWRQAGEQALGSLKTRYGLAAETLPRTEYGMFQYGGREQMAALIDMLSKLGLLYGGR